MNDKDCAVSVSTESSSGLEEGDVTIICQEPKLQNKIETRLADKRYKVVQCLIGGRERAKNLMSSTKHSRTRVVIFTKPENDRFLNDLAPLAGGVCLPFGSTLILHDASVARKQVHSYLRKFQMLRMANDIDDIVKQICFYIEASIESKLRDIKDQTKRNKLFALLLVGTSVNLANSMPYSEVVARFEKRHGSFRNLAVGPLKQFLEEHGMICLEGSESIQVSLKKDGSSIIDSCTERFENSFLLRALGSNRMPVGTTSLPDLPSSSDSQTSVAQPSPLNEPEEWTTVGHLVENNEKEEDLWDVEGERGSFYNKLHNLDSHYAFCLITSEMECREELEGLTNIPFLKVFDFDPNSRTGGLLNSVEELMKEKRSLTITTLNQPVERVSDQATHWVFMKGLTEQGDTVVTENAYKWHKRYYQNLQENCDCLLDHCMLQKPAVFLILWYDRNEKNTEYLQWFLTCVDKVFSKESNQLPCEIILCLPEEPAPDSVLTQIRNNLEISEGLVIADQIDVVTWLANCPAQPETQIKVTSLPKRNEDDKMVEITVPKQQLPWLNDVLEILSFSTPPRNQYVTSDNFGEEFVRGGLLEWDDIRYGSVAVERVILQNVSAFIQNAIEECRSIILRVMHAPGGGGTTFGRQLLWSLRNFAPCCVLVQSTLFPLNGIIERVEVLYKLTYLPVVILVDGRSDSDVERLYASRKYAVVIIHVQRKCTGIKTSRFKGGSCHLAGKVTCKEATNLSQFFSRFSPKKTQALANLRKDVVDKRGSREVFEFGLAAFNHEFKGVQKYVQGYMHEQSRNLQWWQKIIAYLSLLKYYGQCGMYGEVFRKLIPGCEKFVSLPQVTAGSQFIIEEDAVWKINYNEVAREVLEFVLTVNGNTSKSQSGKLSVQAQHSLHSLVVDFIQYIRSSVGDVNPEKLLKLLQRMVTTRDYKDIDISDGLAKKWMLSRLLEDIQLEKNRILVLSEFTKSFPQHAEFHAQLGRLCSFYKDFRQAEKSLNKALELRLLQTKASQQDNTRGRYHHMFGYSYLRKVEFLRNKNLKEALKEAELGVKHFEKGRKFSVYNRIYGYVGEVRIRLLMVEKFAEKYDIEKAFTGKVNPKDLGLCQFVQDSHCVCDHLLVECRYYTSQSELQRYEDYFKCVENFYSYFEELRVTLDRADNYKNIPLTRSRIASIKMKHKLGKNTRDIDDIASKPDITEVVDLLDKTITNALSSENSYVYISVEMQEWLNGIRHSMVPDDHDLLMVWKRMEQWDNRNEFGFSTFYLYVVYILLAMFSSGNRQRKQFWESAMNLFKKIYHKREDYLVKGKELLADHKKLTVRKIISRRHMGDWDNKQKTWSNKDGIAKLRVCTGTIVKSEQPLIGFISVDLDNPIPNCPIRIFFSPKKYDLHGRRFAEEASRVEFFIAFNTNNGAEAESIRLLEKRRCDKCKIATEVITLNKPRNGKCIKCGKFFLKS